MKERILIADDEEQIIKALKRVLMVDYQIYIALSARQALHILETEKIDMIISDIRMPEMDGYELLSRVKEDYPEVIRIVMSGWIDEKTIIRLFYHNIAKMCINKPWNNDELLICLRNVFELNKVFQEYKMLEVIKNLDQLPMLNNIYQEFCNLMDQNVGIQDFEDLLLKDPAVSAELLRIANAAFMNKNIGTLKKAISFLGLNHTKNLVFASSIATNKVRKGKLVLEYQRFAIHSFITNQLVHLIYHSLLSKDVPQDSSCVGILHGIGRIVLMDNFTSQYENIVSSNDNRPLYVIEKEILGINHQEMSSYLLHWWGLPYHLVEAILFHHSPLLEQVLNKELACVIYLADYYASEFVQLPWLDVLDEQVFSFLNVTMEEVKNLANQHTQVN